LRLADLETSVFAFPFVKCRIAHAVPAAQLRHRRPCFLLLQDADDLFFRVPRPLHRPFPLGSGLYLLMAEFSGAGHAGFALMTWQGNASIPTVFEFRSLN